MKTFYSKKDILGRIKEAYKIQKDTELAAFLGVSKSTLSNWVNRDSIDYDKVFSKCEHINLDWLITGRGSMVNNDTATSSQQSIEGNSNVQVGSGGGTVTIAGGKEEKEELPPADYTERIKKQDEYIQSLLEQQRALQQQISKLIDMINK